MDKTVEMCITFCSNGYRIELCEVKNRRKREETERKEENNPLFSRNKTGFAEWMFDRD